MTPIAIKKLTVTQGANENPEFSKTSRFKVVSCIGWLARGIRWFLLATLDFEVFFSAFLNALAVTGLFVFDR